MIQSLYLGFAMADDLTGLPPPSDTLSGHERVFVSVFNCSGFSPYLETLDYRAIHQTLSDVWSFEGFFSCLGAVRRHKVIFSVIFCILF